MPPKKADKKDPGKTCTSKDPTQLQDFANDDNLPKNFLASILKKEGYLEKFKLHAKFNECEYSFEKGNWYAVHVTDDQGNEFFYDRAGNKQRGICYFQIDNRNGEWGIVPESIRFDMPPELEGLRHCQIKENGKCGVPSASPAKGKKTPLPSASSTPLPSPPKNLPKPPKPVPPPRPVAQPVPSDIDEQVMESLKLGFPTADEAASQVSEESGKKNRITREEADKMDKKTLIDWMAKNMYPADILACLRTGALSAQDKTKLEAVETELPVGGGSTKSMAQDDLVAIRASQVLPPQIARKMYKRVTKEEIISQLSGLSGLDKLQGIAELCRRNGKDVKVGKKAGRKPGTFVDALLERGTPVDGDVVDDLLDDCAERDATRLQNLLRSRWSSVMPMVAAAQKKGKFPAMQQAEPPAPQPTNNFEQRVMAALAMPDSEEKGQTIVLLSNEVGLEYDYKVVKKTGKLVIYDDEGSPMSEAAIRISLLEGKGHGFGRRRKTCKSSAKRPLKVTQVRKNFKCAVKTCRKSKNYKKCMKTTLRKIYRKPAFGKKKRYSKRQVSVFKVAAKRCKGKGKGYRKCFRKMIKKMKPKSKPNRSSPKRKCPRVSAASYKVGTVKKGVDGKKWVVKRLKNKINKIKRWVRVNLKK